MFKKMFIIMVYFGLLGLLNILQIQAFDCPHGWQKSEWNCYLVVNDMVDFDAAMATCQEQHGTLAEPRTEIDNNFIASHLKSSAWTGYTDYVQKGKFVGVFMKEVVSYTNWKNGEPDNKGDDDLGHCVVIGEHDKDEGQWSVVNCKDKMSYVCQLYVSRPKVSCPDNWKPYDGSCFLPSNDKNSWYKANEYCQSLGGKVFEPTEAAQVEFLFSSLNGYIWAGGLTDHDVEAVEPINRNKRCCFFPTDYHCMVYNSDAKMQVDVIHPFHCEAKASYVCQVDASYGQ